MGIYLEHHGNISGDVMAAMVAMVAMAIKLATLNGQSLRNDQTVGVRSITMYYRE